MQLLSNLVTRNEATIQQAFADQEKHDNFEELLARIKNIEHLLQLYLVPRFTAYTSDSQSFAPVPHGMYTSGPGSLYSSCSGSFYSSGCGSQSSSFTPYHENVFPSMSKSPEHEVDNILASFELPAFSPQPPRTQLSPVHQTPISASHSASLPELSYDNAFEISNSTQSTHATPNAESTQSTLATPNAESTKSTLATPNAESTQSTLATPNADSTQSILATHAESLSPTDICGQLGLSPNLVKALERESNSRQNLAVNIVRNVYTKRERERESSNVYIRKGKKRLDPVKMALVRKLTYSIKLLKPGEDENENWEKTCTVAIDSANSKAY